MYKSSWKIAKPADFIKIGTIIFGGAWFVGSLIFLTYCIQVGFVPQGLSISDSIYFSWLMLIFLVCYALVATLFFCFGTVSFYWIAKISLSRGASDRDGYLRLYERDWSSFSRFGDSTKTILVYGAAAVAFLLLILGVVNAQDWSLALSLFVIPFALVFGLRTHVLASRKLLRLRRRKARVLLERPNAKGSSGEIALRHLRKRIRKQRVAARTGLALAIAMPLSLGLFPGLNLAAMSFVHLRESKATVLVRKDICAAVQSRFPDNFADRPYGGYCELTDMTVLMMGLGGQIVVSTSADTKHFMPLPSSDVISVMSSR